MVSKQSSYHTSMLNVTWTIRCISPLRGFNITNDDFTKYSKHLSAWMQSWHGSGLAVETSSISQSHCYIAVIKSIQIEDSESMLSLGTPQVHIHLTQPNGNIAIAMLLSGTQRTHISPHLPIMITTGGNEYIWRTVTHWMHEQFDCRCSLLTSSPLQMAAMGLHWTEKEIPKWAFRGPLCLIYSTRCMESVKDDLRTITITIKEEDMFKLFKIFFDNIVSNDDSEDVSQCIRIRQQLDVLLTHFYQHFRISLHAFQLIKISTANFTISNHEDVFKLTMSSPALIEPFLKRLTLFGMHKLSPL